MNTEKMTAKQIAAHIKHLARNYKETSIFNTHQRGIYERLIEKYTKAYILKTGNLPE